MAPKLPIPRAAKERLPEWRLRVADRMGLTGPMAREVQREVTWWAHARMHAARSRRRLYHGLCIGWTSSGYAELLPVEVPAAGRGEVTVLTHSSVVSLEEERAGYLRLPGASSGRGIAGHSSAGVVIATGPDVDGIGEGDVVAVDGGPHASLATVPASRVDPVPKESLGVSDLPERRLDPREAGLFYRELAKDASTTSAYFDWTAVPEGERRRRGRLLRLPAVAGRGVDMDRRPLSPPRRRRRLAEEVGLADPFRGAAGMLRIGMLGCGDIAASSAAAVRSAPNTRLVAAFDPVESLARDIAAPSGAEVAPSAEALVERRDVDAVLISVPHHLHAPLALEAMAAGKHVIVEKPMANTLAAAVEMTDAAERAGVVLSVAFAYRYQPSALIARRLIDAGAVGPVGGCFVRSIADKTPPYWVGGYSGRSPSDWRMSREKAGGGMLIMNLTHYIDLFRHLTGLDADELWAQDAVTDGPMEVEDSIAVAVRYGNGALGTVTGYSAARGTLNEEFRIWGGDGHVAIEPDGRVFTLRAIEGYRTARWQRFGAPAGGAMRARYFSRLATAIHEGRAPDVSAEDGLAVQAFVEAAYRAAETGRGVRPSELLASYRAGAVPLV